ncbi:hypothetical protein TNIN_58921 [Trichonephila inaurata madagascariensis]|uniref:Uncharacterized protein n=1 Tax=Trichonephila inaurata madagascariensis TaxID=2747483 RepID=A0A8X6X7U9_9ARAC|nr:hypothetical protein TNIN_58921 [Trichonephila inaurata madagascariensis]
MAQKMFKVSTIANDAWLRGWTMDWRTLRILLDVRSSTSDSDNQIRFGIHWEVHHHIETIYDIRHIVTQGQVNIIAAATKGSDNLKTLEVIATSKSSLTAQPKPALKTDVGQHVFSCHGYSRHNDK